MQETGESLPPFTAKVSKILMIGAAILFIHLNAETIKTGIRNKFENKEEKIIRINLEAIRLGLFFTKHHQIN
jgi:Pyruvate/2-oxoacid:ferredoxin oxidoreductase gamma subunit